MNQSIITKKLAPTNTKGTRIKASCDAGNVTIGYDHSLNCDQNHRKAAKALCAKLGWEYVLVSGSLGAHRVHTPLYDRYAARSNTDSHTSKYRPHEIERVAQSMRVDPEFNFGQMKCYGQGGAKTRYLNVTEREVGALLALFNQNDVD